MVAHLHFFANSQTNSKKCKRATKPTHHETTNSNEMNRRKKALGHNSGFAKKRVQWLIEHSTSHQLLCYVDSFELRNPLLRKAPNR
ncbi:MAG: hypothetical protein EAZ27_12130 [Cytophagales bacterium]|nr:MAG: hypothetical protein EAZ27_12130 [Cytophagales bacterium]